MQLVAGSQGLLEGSVVVGGVEIENVHAGGLEAGQGLAGLLLDTCIRQGLPIKWINLSSHNNLKVGEEGAHDSAREGQCVWS